jgi:hypothetical protein
LGGPQAMNTSVGMTNLFGGDVGTANRFARSFLL